MGKAHFLQKCYDREAKRQLPAHHVGLPQEKSKMPPTHRRAPSRDAELGKRDDDYRPRAKSQPSGLMSVPVSWRKRRVVLVLIGLVLVYLFFHNMPTDLPSIDERYGKPMRPGHTIQRPQDTAEPTGPPRRSIDDSNDPVHYYNGPIKFYRLATTLRGISKTRGARMENRNILFAASSLKSVANLMPLACQMARVDRNYVHLAVLGRDPLPLEDILNINGVDSQSCPVFFHDARGDYAAYSSDTRAEISVSGAMKHINDFMHPQAIIMDDSSLEDFFFIRAIRKRASEYGRALIEIPADRYEDFLWMTRLDSGSLASWFYPTIDILIHAPQDSSGGLIRLIKSLERADYSGMRAPRLTIELPNDVEPFARSYIEGLVWPPDKKASPLKTNALSLRHRIQTSRLNSEGASLRFVESFFPSSTYNDHVLVLSPQAEVHPLYLHYLYYITLEYRYSAEAVAESDDLLGLALDVPTSFINGSLGFEAPKLRDMQPVEDSEWEKHDKDEPAPFIYQAPSSTASLIFGDKWVTFHNFLSRRLEMAAAGKSEAHVKQVSETEPAWMEYLLELMSARSWNMLHPAYSVATVHGELARIPEEYLREFRDKKSNGDGTQPVVLPESAFLTADEPPKVQPHAEMNSDDSTSSLLNLLPFDGELTELTDLPHVYRNGKLFTPEGNADFQHTYITWFRQHIGGCDADVAAKKRKVNWLSADDLFCVPGIPPDFDVEDEKQAEVDGEAAREIESVVKKESDAAEHLVKEVDNAEAPQAAPVAGPAQPARDISGAGEVDDVELSADEMQEGNQV